MIKNIKLLLLIPIISLLCLCLNSGTAFAYEDLIFADNQIQEEQLIEYTLGDEYYEEHINNESFDYLNFKFSLSKKSDVSAIIQSSNNSLEISFYGLSEDFVTNQTNTETLESKSGDTLYSHTCDLEPGDYVLIIQNNDRSNSECHIYVNTLIKEFKELSVSQIKSINKSSYNSINIVSDKVEYADGYNFQISSNKSFKHPFNYEWSNNNWKEEGMLLGYTYYVRVRPYTNYYTEKVYGEWSKVKSIYLEKFNNSLTLKNKSKTVSAKDLKKSNKKIKMNTIQYTNAKLTYSISKVPSKAKKYLSMSKSGALTVKKNMKPGTYKFKVKVVSSETSQYKSANINKQFKLVVKK